MKRVAGITSNTVPWEILRAAGYSPGLLEDEPGPTPHADRFMEDVFARRFRVIFDRLCAGAWKHIETVVIPRTSEQEHKLYLYLREVSRLGYSQSVPRLYFYNLLHTQTPGSYAYGLERTREMVRALDASESDLWSAIEESNRARAVLREILQRRREGRLEGSAAIAMIGRYYTQHRAEFAQCTLSALQRIEPAAARTRPRILIEGASLDYARDPAALHRAIEQAGGYVVAEDDWRGSRAAGDQDIRTNGDPVVALFEKYFHDTVSPRVHPPEKADAWLRREIESSGVDGVIFYLPPEDDVRGWDYPRQAAFVRSLSVPSVVIRQSDSTEISTFIAKLR